MSADDLNKVDKAKVKLDKYVTMLQIKYGCTREQAKIKLTNAQLSMNPNKIKVPSQRDLVV